MTDVQEDILCPWRAEYARRKERLLRMRHIRMAVILNYSGTGSEGSYGPVEQWSWADTGGIVRNEQLARRRVCR